MGLLAWVAGLAGWLAGLAGWLGWLAWLACLAGLLGRLAWLAEPQFQKLTAALLQPAASAGTAKLIAGWCHSSTIPHNIRSARVDERECESKCHPVAPCSIQ